MKKFTLPVVFLAAVFAVSSCLDPKVDSSDASLPAAGAAREGLPGRGCATMDVLAEQLKSNPDLAKKYEEVERFTQNFLARRGVQGQVTTAASITVTIPVAVHVIYNTTQQNISLAQIQSQIDVLNNDYSNTNADRTLLPSVFSALPTDMHIRFTLNTADIDRKKSTRKAWGTNDAMKSSKTGGIDPKTPSQYLNIWVCNIGGGILGYAQFPGGAPATDGVVIGPQYFGNTGYVAAPYDKGRTATHEVGHWVNLRHIWGDATCGDDLVSDTPTQQTSNYGCPAFPRVTCGNGPNGDLFMNYMDYTDDACMYMFTKGQDARSQAIFAPGGPRQSFVTP